MYFQTLPVVFYLLVKVSLSGLAARLLFPVVLGIPLTLCGAGTPCFPLHFRHGGRCHQVRKGRRSRKNARHLEDREIFEVFFIFLSRCYICLWFLYSFPSYLPSCPLFLFVCLCILWCLHHVLGEWGWGQEVWLHIFIRWLISTCFFKIKWYDLVLGHMSAPSFKGL